MKTKKSIFTTILGVCLFFCFTAFWGCEGSNDPSTPPDVDISNFSGLYIFTVSNVCGETDTWRLTLGDDESKKGEEDYIYLSANVSSGSYVRSNGSESETITYSINGDVVTISGVGSDTSSGDSWSHSLTLEFSSDYKKVNLDGSWTATDIDEDDCPGAFTGTASRFADTGVPLTFTRVSFPLTIKAHIDGLSQLKIRGESLWWHHVYWEPPGLWNADFPTYLNDQPWYPIWPMDDLTNCNCDSNVLNALESKLDNDAEVSVDVIAGRGSVTVIEQPSLKNNYTAIIKFDDNQSGASWYEVVINVE